jgi:hypothetical protein
LLQPAATSVCLSVIARTTPNHPLRLAGIFAASLAFFGIVAGAAGALAYVVHDVRASHVAAPSASVPTQAQMNLPSGVIALQGAANAGEFTQLAGFSPFVPKQLPEHTKNDLSLSVALPDANGIRAGRVGYSPSGAASPDGITGPTVVLWETKGAPDASTVGAFHQLAGAKGRVMVATAGCGGLTLKMELYFQPDPAPGDTVVTPYMSDTAQKFLDGVRGQCK